MLNSEYYLQFQLKNVEALEPVQKRFTSTLPGLKRINYKGNLLGMFSLDFQRPRGNLIAVYNYQRHRQDMIGLFPGVEMSNIRGHGLSERRKLKDVFFLMQGACKILQGEVIEANTITCKRHLDWHLNRQMLMGYGSWAGRQDEFKLALWVEWPVLYVLCFIMYLIHA